MFAAIVVVGLASAKKHRRRRFKLSVPDFSEPARDRDQGRASIHPDIHGLTDKVPYDGTNDIADIVQGNFLRTFDGDENRVSILPNEFRVLQTKFLVKARSETLASIVL